MDAGNLLKPMLARGELHCIGATTLDEYRQYIEKDAALERRFQPVTVAEPSIQDAVQILLGIKGYYEKYHNVRVSDATAKRIVVLSERYISDRYLPDKAIDLNGGQPATTKENKESHGYGIKSIRKAAEKYGGCMTLEQQDGWFIMTVLIPLAEENK